LSRNSERGIVALVALPPTLACLALAPYHESDSGVAKARLLGGARATRATSTGEKIKTILKKFVASMRPAK